MRVNLIAAVNPEVPSASGVRTYVLNLAKNLARLGQEVTVIGSGSRPYETSGFSFRPVVPQGSSATAFILGIARYLKRDGGLDGLVHANRPDDLAPFHLERGDLVTVLTLHGVHGIHVRAKRGAFVGTAYGIVERYSLQRTGAVICISPDTLSHFTANYPTIRDRFRMIPTGIDLDTFRIRSQGEARARFHLASSDQVLAFVGRFVPEKNPVFVAKEFLALSRRHPEAHLLMIGDGPLNAEVRAVARSSAGRITVRSPGTQDDLAALLPAIDLLIIASRHEGLPTIALESLACGRPIVGTRVGILPDIVKEGENGFLVDDLSRLSLVIERALYKTAWTEERCRSSVRNFGWDRVTPELISLYQEVSS